MSRKGYGHQPKDGCEDATIPHRGHRARRGEAKRIASTSERTDNITQAKTANAHRPEKIDGKGTPTIQPLGWSRVTATYAGNPREPLKIYFDHFTSGGKKQKGYGTCRTALHERCVCWKSAFGTLEEYCSNMVAWEQASHFSDRTAHMAHVPSEADIGIVRATLRLERF